MDEHGARRAVCDPSREDCAGTAAARGGETARGRAEARAPQDEASQACGEGAAHVQGIGGRRRGHDEVEGRTVCLASGREQGSEAGCTHHSSARLEPRSSARLERLVSASASAGSAPAASSGAAVFTASTIAAASVAATSVSAAAFAASTSTAAWYDCVEYYHHLDHDEHHKHDDVDHDDHAVAAADCRDDDNARAVRLRASSSARTESKQECPAPEQI
jgi:hypothetical protein